MTEDARAVNAYREPGAPSFEEVTSASDVMLAMVRTAKGLRIYLPNNPVLIKFLEEFNAKMTEHLARFGEFRIEVNPFAFRYKGADIYQNNDAKESLAFRVYSDGVRLLIFSPGLEQRELTVFLGIVAFEQASHQDDDIVTQLWVRSLPHITYVLEEDFVQLDQEDLEAERGSQQEAISRVFAALASESAAPPRTIPKHLLMLTRDEASWLRKAKQAEVCRNSLEEVISILSCTLAGTRDPRDFRDFVALTSQLAVNMFLAGDIGHALKLVRILDRLSNHPSKGPDERALLRQALSGILSERTVQVLQETVDGGETVSHDELRELLQLFGLPSLEAICELLGRVEKLKMRKVIVEVLVELGKDRPEVFAPFLLDPRWYLVRNVVLVLSLLETPVALEMIVGLISHREQRIRREVLGFLERSADPKAKAYIVKYLRDESSSLRIKALQILSRERQAFALKPILALLAAEEFKSKDIAEKKAVYEAVGELGSERMLPMFKEMLRKKYWFKKGMEKESVICAVAGLSKIGSKAAVELLKEARNQRNPEVRGIVEQALVSLASAGMAVNGGEV